MLLHKKAHVRVLSGVAESTADGGIALGDIPAPILLMYEKVAETEVIESILTTGEMILLVEQIPGSAKWVCTAAGIKEYRSICNNRKWLLERTTSPKLPMRA